MLRDYLAVMDVKLYKRQLHGISTSTGKKVVHIVDQRQKNHWKFLTNLKF